MEWVQLKRPSIILMREYTSLTRALLCADLQENDAPQSWPFVASASQLCVVEFLDQHGFEGGVLADVNPPCSRSDAHHQVRRHLSHCDSRAHSLPSHHLRHLPPQH